MNIKLTENYRISSDKLNIILEERYEKRDGKGKHAKGTGEYDYKAIGYYGKLDHLVNALVKLEVVNTDVENLHDIVHRIEDLTEEIKNHLADKITLKLGKEDK